MTSRIVLVSSPGFGDGCHWSHAFAGELARCLVTSGASVQWFQVARPAAATTAMPMPAALAPAALAASVLSMPRRPGIARVMADNRHAAVEAAVTATLRAGPVDAVVHVGAGARGSPNVCWLADRLGVRCFAAAHAAEVVCHRGDLRHAEGTACTRFLDAERCRACCATSFWARPAAVEFRNRGDLLVASLQVTQTTFVPSAEDRERLVAFGVPERVLAVEQDAAVIAASLGV